MGARLGNVLNGIGCLVAVLCIVGGGLMAMSDPGHAGIVFGIMAGIGVLAFGTGKALQYILGGA